MPRIVLGIEYDGSQFHGWQWQDGKRSVQGELQAGLSKVADQPVTVLCAGRTDAGVHALEQVVHFDCEAERDMRAWVMGGNSQLPGDVRILWAKPAIADFHARYSAIARFYRYVFFNRPVKSALARNQVTWCYEALDAEKMHQAAQVLIGEHDFSSFRAHGCQSKSPRRLMYFIDVYRDGDRVIIDLSANAFVHHMVRNIAGVLMDIGRGRRSPDWTEHLLKVKDREQGGVTASPHGLYLGGVYYPERYGLVYHPIFKRLPKDAKRFD
ncbi:tRNA pseudouridine(38-40) synthase TruA [Methylomarinum sp. Ch1-1]|uniref:tRNA pseudouridine synthase A n=1 Tax=Methylomarinum roseum TaxID=3067653 RepID=A0AAU7NQU7_9GAMM|nr:tRNA pseudouridine(38-40) synthase TruA [Methylomarinum sp. Ch1-1]MDP4521049.1 tRNA pseudouridine(38-40) synthase TruA [Methylomarinum sp. Ch1-1]